MTVQKDSLSASSDFAQSAENHSDLDHLSWEELKQEVIRGREQLSEAKLDEAHDWTGLLTKDHFKTACHLLFKQSFNELPHDRPERRVQENSKENVALIMFDGASFKKFNDTYGHQEGDRLIAYIATMIAKSFRAEDVVGHFGGDEFVVAVKNVRKDLLERKCRAINAHMEFQLQDGTSVSPMLDFGIYFPKLDEDIDVAIEHVDQELYINKEARKTKEKELAPSPPVKPTLG